MDKVCVRFAPSPTGMLHIGSLRTALFNWLWAKKNKGKFILRIEDTDRSRFVEGAVENIKDALKWYGLDYDEGPLFQSERLGIYKKYSEELIKKDKAYYCFCTPERLDEVRKIQRANKQATQYDGLCRSLSKEEVEKKLNEKGPFVVRLKVPHEGVTEFKDLIHEKISVNNSEIDDQVLMKSDGFPTYHLANIVDDHEQGVTHVIRAEEWLPSTPKHIILYQAFDWQLPIFAHLPMVLGPDKSKLSKRHGALPALDYRGQGYLPEAIINFIALLGWNPKTDQEIFSIEELTKQFDLSKVNKSSAIFNVEKLDWLNSQYIKRMDTEKLVNERRPYYEKEGFDINNNSLVEACVELEKDRLTKLSDSTEVAQFILTDDFNYDKNILIPKKETVEKVLNVLEQTKKMITKLSQDEFDSDKLKSNFEKFITKYNLNNKIVLWPLRVALTGLEKSPGVFEVMKVIGKEQTLNRTEKAIEMLNK